LAKIPNTVERSRRADYASAPGYAGKTTDSLIISNSQHLILKRNTNLDKYYLFAKIIIYIDFIDFI
jgi:hypothetical protein